MEQNVFTPSMFKGLIELKEGRYKNIIENGEAITKQYFFSDGVLKNIYDYAVEWTTIHGYDHSHGMPHLHVCCAMLLEFAPHFNIVLTTDSLRTAMICMLCHDLADQKYVTANIGSEYLYRFLATQIGERTANTIRCIIFSISYRAIRDSPIVFTSLEEEVKPISLLVRWIDAMDAMIRPERVFYYMDAQQPRIANRQSHAKDVLFTRIYNYHRNGYFHNFGPFAESLIDEAKTSLGAYIEREFSDFSLTDYEATTEITAPYKCQHCNQFRRENIHICLSNFTAHSLRN